MNFIAIEKAKLQDGLADFQEKNLFEKTNVLSFACFCLFLLDCCVSGGGRYLEIYGISLRIVLGAFCVFFAIPTLIKNWKTHLKEPVNFLFIPFVVWFVICAIRGLVNDNNYVVFMSDLKGFLYLFLIPISVNCVREKNRINAIMNVILLGALLQALLVFAINIYCASETENLMKLYYPVVNIQLGTVSDISSSIYRIFMGSGPYLIAGCVVAIWRQLKSQRFQVVYSILTAIYLNALLFSYTRSLYGSVFITAFVTVIIVFIIYPKLVRKVIKHLAVAMIVALLLIATEEVVFEANYLNFAIARTFGTEIKVSPTSTLLRTIRAFIGQIKGIGYVGDNDDTDEDKEIADQEGYLQITMQSDELRRVTQNELVELIKKEPIVGNGLGAFAPSRNGPDEFFYLDMLARMGIIGLLLYTMPYMYILIVAIKKRTVLLSACICLPFWIATAFNPWMNAAIGISCYAVTMAVTKHVRDGE